VTLTAVVALTLAACGSGSTTTTEDTRGWSDEAFRDLMAYCQATGDFGTCAAGLILSRDSDQCSVEATYRIIDHLDGIDGDERGEAGGDFMRDVLQPAGDCLRFGLPDE